MTGERQGSDAESPFLRQLLAYRPQLLVYIRTLAGPDQMEDIFQQVTVVLLERQHDLTEAGNFHSWCRSVARHIAWRERDRSRRLIAINDEQLLDLVDEALSELPGSDVLNHQKMLLQKCTEQLSEANRLLLKERYTRNKSLKEIASSSNRSEGSLQVTFYRIRKALQQCIERLGGGRGQ
jgi:RNA polymerase sigma-70 factor, ECF subfamily